MGRDSEGSNGNVVNAACPLHCGSSRTGANAAEQVEWAGLPVNLDLAFSTNQRDKVYAQYLKRRRDTEARRWREMTTLCVCELAEPSFDTDRSVSGL